MVLSAIPAFYPRILRVEADLPSSWLRHPENPLLGPGPSGSWDYHVGIGAPCVLLDDGVFMMWYNSEYVKNGHDYIGAATSNDGIHWEKYTENPVLNPGSGWEWGRLQSPSVIKDEGIFKMWYTGQEGKGLGHARIGYATSDDGFNWNRYHANPVLDLGSTNDWDDDLTSHCCVIRDGSIYKMWYTGRSSSGGNRIGYATSSDGVNWNKYLDNPVLDLGLPGEIDATAVGHPTVLKENGQYSMWYIAVTDNPERTHTIGYASSEDGIEWTKNLLNPALEPIPENSWESVHVTVGTVIRDEGVLKMWYAGRASNPPSYLCYAHTQTQTAVPFPIEIVAVIVIIGVVVAIVLIYFTKFKK